MVATTLVVIVTSFFLSFITPFLFAGAAAIINFIFETFSNPFRFTFEAGADGTIPTNWFVNMLGSDLLNIIVKIMIGAGVVIAIFILATNLFKLFFTGISRKVDSPISLCIRAVFSIFMSYWIIDIVYKVVFPLFQWLLDKVNSITVHGGTTVVNAINNCYSAVFTSSSSWLGLDEGSGFMSDLSESIAGLASNVTYDVFAGIISAVVFLIFFFKTIFSVFKLITEMAERYLLINVLTICSPMVMPTIISNGTMQIFMSWVQMMIANSLVLIFNSLGMIMLKIAFINVGVSCSAFGNNGSAWTSAIMSMIVYVALIKVVQKFDVYLAQLAFKIQAIGGENKGMTLAGLMAMTGRANKKAADIAEAGGIKNATGQKLGNFLGVINGNRTGLAGELSKDAQETRSFNAAQDKAGGSARFKASEEGLEMEKLQKDTELRNLNNEELQEKQMSVDTRKLNNQANELRSEDYRAAMTEKNIAELGRQTNELEDNDYRSAVTGKNIAEMNRQATELGDKDYLDTKVEHETAKLEADSYVKLDPEHQAAAATNAYAKEVETYAVNSDEHVIDMKAENSVLETTLRDEKGKKQFDNYSRKQDELFADDDEVLDDNEE